MDVLPPTTPGAGGHRPMLPRYTPCALAVAGDATRRNVLETRLRRQGYLVTPCSHPVVAMAVLRDRRGGFDLVVVDMSPPRSGALELFECAISEMRVRAYAMSQVGNFYGPLAMDDLDTFRQPIKSKASNESRSSKATPNSLSSGSVTATASTITTTSSPGRRATSRRRRQPSETGSQEVEQDREHREVQQQQPDQRPKKARLVWTPELHSKFVDAHNTLLPGDAVPKKILKLMNDATLTRENIASHLQKYRLNLKGTEPQPLHRDNPRIKYHRTAPSQASFLSPDMAQQKEIVMACRAAEDAAFYMNYGLNTQTVIGGPAVSDMQNNRPELHMQAFEAVNMNKECIVDTVHVRDEWTGRGTVPKEMYTRARVKHELDVEPKPVTADSHNNSDGSFQEDHSKIIQQTLNKVPGPSWDYEFLHHSA